MSEIQTNELKIESSLKQLLQQILQYLEGFLESQSDIHSIESKLQDYDDMPDLIQIIQSIFGKLVEKINKRIYGNHALKNNNTINHSLNIFSIDESDRKLNEYQRLELTIQKHEAEIRKRISNENQMRLMIEQLQSELDESEDTRTEFIAETSKIIKGIKKENAVLCEQLKLTNLENAKLQKQIQQTLNINQNQSQFENKHQQIYEMVERMENFIVLLKNFKKENSNLSSQLKFFNIENSKLLKKISIISSAYQEYESRFKQIPEMIQQVEHLLEFLRVQQKTHSINKEIISNNKFRNDLKVISTYAIGKEHNEPQKINQSTDNQATSLLSTKIGGALINSGSSPIKQSRKSYGANSQKNRISRPVSESFYAKDNRLNRQKGRGISMDIKYDALKLLEQGINKSYSLGVTKHNSQEINIMNDLMVKNQNKKASYQPLLQLLSNNPKNNCLTDRSQMKNQKIQEWKNNMLKQKKQSK